MSFLKLLVFWCKQNVPESVLSMFNNFIKNIMRSIVLKILAIDLFFVVIVWSSTSRTRAWGWSKLWGWWCQRCCWTGVPAEINQTNCKLSNFILSSSSGKVWLADVQVNMFISITVLKDFQMHNFKFYKLMDFLIIVF